MDNKEHIISFLTENNLLSYQVKGGSNNFSIFSEGNTIEVYYDTSSGRPTPKSVINGYTETEITGSSIIEVAKKGILISEKINNDNIFSQTNTKFNEMAEQSEAFYHAYKISEPKIEESTVSRTLTNKQGLEFCLKSRLDEKTKKPLFHTLTCKEKNIMKITSELKEITWFLTKESLLSNKIDNPKSKNKNKP